MALKLIFLSCRVVRGDIEFQTRSQYVLPQNPRESWEGFFSYRNYEYSQTAHPKYTLGLADASINHLDLALGTCSDVGFMCDDDDGDFFLIIQFAHQLHNLIACLSI